MRSARRPARGGHKLPIAGPDTRATDAEFDAESRE
jgi:hypothetical protein